MTLAFLADVPDIEIARTLREPGPQRREQLTGFPVGLAGAGAFPASGQGHHPVVRHRSRRHRTLSAGRSGGVGGRASTGLSLDDRPFRPHLTLARCQPTDAASRS